MCELLGLSFSQPVSADVAIEAFAARDCENADGWGLAWYEDHSLAIVKEPLRWRQSPFASFLQTYEHLRSHLFIGHVRHATTGGEPSRADTHPFQRELFGRSYCFAHNGTVRGVIVATRPLDDATWHPLRFGELLVLADGATQFSGVRTRRTRAESQATIMV